MQFFGLKDAALSRGLRARGALAEGYPLRWLTAHQNEPVISKGALLKDCAQWALGGMSVLYLGWLWLTAPAACPTSSRTRR